MNESPSQRSRRLWPYGGSSSAAAALAVAGMLAQVGNPLGRPVVVVEDETPAPTGPLNHKGQPLTQADLDAIERARIKKERKAAKKQSP